MLQCESTVFTGQYFSKYELASITLATLITNILIVSIYHGFMSVSDSLCPHAMATKNYE
jgi:hypothetical protein